MLNCDSCLLLGKSSSIASATCCGIIICGFALGVNQESLGANNVANCLINLQLLC